MCFQSHCHRCAKFASRSMSSNGSDETAQWIRQRRFMDVAKVDVQKVGVTEEDRDRNRWTQMIHSVNPKWCSWKTKGSEINTLYESILSLINSLVFSFPTSYESPFLLLALLVSVLFHLSYSVVCLNPDLFPSLYPANKDHQKNAEKWNNKESEQTDTNCRIWWGREKIIRNVDVCLSALVGVPLLDSAGDVVAVSLLHSHSAADSIEVIRTSEGLCRSSREEVSLTVQPQQLRLWIPACRLTL